MGGPVGVAVMRGVHGAPNRVAAPELGIPRYFHHINFAVPVVAVVSHIWQPERRAHAKVMLARARQDARLKIPVGLLEPAPRVRDAVDHATGVPEPVGALSAVR